MAKKKQQGKASSKPDKSFKLARTLRNKQKRIALHLKMHPKDSTVHGSVPDYKLKPKGERAQRTKPTMMHDIDGYFNKKSGKIEVPLVMYAVYGDGHNLVEYTHLPKVAEEAFAEMKCRAVLIAVINNKFGSVIKHKGPVPMMTKDQRLAGAFGKQ